MYLRNEYSKTLYVEAYAPKRRECPFWQPILARTPYVESLVGLRTEVGPDAPIIKALNLPLQTTALVIKDGWVGRARLALSCKGKSLLLPTEWVGGSTQAACRNLLKMDGMPKDWYEGY